MTLEVTSTIYEQALRAQTAERAHSCNWSLLQFQGLLVTRTMDAVNTSEYALRLTKTLTPGRWR